MIRRDGEGRRERTLEGEATEDEDRKEPDSVPARAISVSTTRRRPPPLSETFFLVIFPPTREVDNAGEGGGLLIVPVLLCRYGRWVARKWKSP